MARDSNSPSLSYTLVGERSNSNLSPRAITFLLLMREGTPTFRDELFKFLSEFSFVAEVIVAERHNSSVDLESYVRRYPKVRFLMMGSEHTIGERINAGILEADTDFVFVLWSDCEIQNPFWFSSLVEDMRARNHLCVVPELLDKDLESLPCIHVPVYYEKTLKVIDLPPEESTHQSLYPHDYMGLYARPLFMALGGFDPQIVYEFWQKLDFGMRAFEWGEIISTSRKMKLRYLATPKIETVSQAEGYDRFYLKNYWPYHVGDHIEVSFWRFLELIKPSGIYWREIPSRYAEVKGWLKRHKYRFKKDLKGVIELWDNTDFF